MCVILTTWGLQAAGISFGTGTWVESKVDLVAFRGQRVRLLHVFLPVEHSDRAAHPYRQGRPHSPQGTRRLKNKDPKLLLFHAPLLRQDMTTPKAMRDVIYALLPATAASLWFFGLSAVSIPSMAWFCQRSINAQLIFISLQI